MKKITEILKRCESIFIAAKAPKSDIRVLHNFIEDIVDSDNQCHDNFSNYSKGKDKKTKSNKPERGIYKKKPSNIEIIADVYRKINKGMTLNSSEKEILNEVEKKYPNIRDFLVIDFSKLYDKISEIDEKSWTIEELKIISYFHLYISPKQKTTKAEILNNLKKNIYNKDYMESMKKQYENPNIENINSQKEDDLSEKSNR